MRVIVAGSRDITDENFMEYHLNQLEDMIHFDEVVSGCARGPDEYAIKWAETYNLPVSRYPADWKTHGPGAGYIRNAEMAKNADMLVAFWDGESSGTKHMIEQAMKDKLDIYVIQC